MKDPSEIPSLPTMEVAERVVFDHDEAKPLPEVFQGELDGALFEALMDDLVDCAEIHAVYIKSDVEAHADEPRVALDQARMLLLLGKVRGIQIHYRHEGVTWIDTLLRGPNSIRLVRMEAPVQVSAEESAPAPDAPKGEPPKRKLRVLP